MDGWKMVGNLQLGDFFAVAKRQVAAHEDHGLRRRGRGVHSRIGNNNGRIEGDMDSALLRIVPPQEPGPAGLIADLEAAMESWKRVPWTTLAEARGNPDALKALLESLRKALSP
jgi:hypothetical protein